MCGAVHALYELPAKRERIIADPGIDAKWLRISDYGMVAARARRSRGTPPRALVSTHLTSPSLWEGREERAGRVTMVAVCSTSIRVCGAGPPLAVARPSRREGERDNDSPLPAATARGPPQGALISTHLTSPSLREGREERAGRATMVAVCSTSVRDCGAGPPLAVARPSRREGERDNVRFV